MVGIYLFVLLLFALGAVVVALNIWYYKQRRNMTPEERKKEDAEMRVPGDW